MENKNLIKARLDSIKENLPEDVKLVAVSKFHNCDAIMEAYNAGQRVFGESRPQEFDAKYPELPKDIEWHFIGHLQRNKVKLVMPAAHLVESVDSLRLLRSINTWGQNNDKTINVLLEVHIADEETKYGFTRAQVRDILDNQQTELAHISFCGLMGMATNTDDENLIRQEFAAIRDFKDEINKTHPELQHFNELSIGMSGDYKIAIEYGATIVRIGTAIFGPREY